MKTTHIVIIGGGFAGLRAFYRLHENKQVQVTLIDKRLTSVEKPSLPEVAFSGKHVEDVLLDLNKIITKKGGKYINGDVVKINPELKHIHLLDDQKIEYDYLIITSGAIKDYNAIKGFERYGDSMCDETHAAKLWEKLKGFKGGNIVMGTAKSTFGSRVEAPKLIAPCEGPIGEAMFMIDHMLRKKNLRNKTNLTVFTPGEIFFEDVGDHVRNSVGKIMQGRDMTLFKSKVVTEITKDKILFEDNTSLDADLSIVIPPYKAANLFKNSDLGDEAGFIPTDKTMKHLDYDSIYAAGDITALAQPKLGHIAIHQADIACSAILKEITGKGEIIKFEPSIFCIMNMGGNEATLIFSNKLYNGKNDVAFHSPLAHLMKWGFDSYYFFTQGHMPPDFSMIGMEKFLKLFKEDPDKEIPFE